MATEERWVSVEEVAVHLGVAKDTVYRWIEERELPAHRVGRLLRFKLSEIDEWVRQDSRKEKRLKSGRARTNTESAKEQEKAKRRSRKRRRDE